MYIILWKPLRFVPGKLYGFNISVSPADLRDAGSYTEQIPFKIIFRRFASALENLYRDENPKFLMNNINYTISPHFTIIIVFCETRLISAILLKLENRRFIWFANLNWFTSFVSRIIII